MKQKLFIFTATIGLTVASNAATVSIARSGAGTGVLARDFTGVDLSAGGYYIGVGTYALVPTITNDASFQAAVTNFSLFGSTVAPTTGTTTGLIVGSITATDTTFNSAMLYILVGNGATKAASTAFAILQGTPSFSFAANVGVAGSTTYTLANATSFQPLTGAGTEIDNVTGADGVQLRSLVAIPEPTAAALGAVGVLCLLRRRRN